LDFSSSLLSLGSGVLPESFDGLKSELPLDWIRQCLSAHGIATLRRRKLPAENVVWMIVGLALFRNRRIPEVVQRLDLILPDAEGNKRSLSEGAITPARDRVGAEPLRGLFKLTCDRWGQDSAKRHAWRGLKVLGIDATTLRVPDTRENRDEFGQLRGSSYPLVRMAALMVLRSRTLLDCAISGCRTGEATLAAEMIPTIPNDSVTILDRYFHCYWIWQAIRSDEKNRHWIVRARDDVRNWKTVQRLGPNDDLVEIAPSTYARWKHPEVSETIRARAIRYRRKGFKPRTILTSLLDPLAFPAKELSALYHERWELEIGYNEIKTTMLEQRESIRSKTPERVMQELWGLVTAYNLLRREMEAAAVELGVPPIRISFLVTLNLARDLFYWAEVASPGKWPEMFDKFRLDMRRVILAPRRTRSYRRHVKRPVDKYPANVGHLA